MIIDLFPRKTINKNPSPDAADQFKRIHEAFEGLFYQSTPAQREGEGSDCDLFSDELPGALHRDWVAADHGLYEAVWHEDVELAKMLLKEGARPDQYRNNVWGGTALMLAAQSGNMELVMLLLLNGADVGAQDLRGNTPEDWARRRQHPEVLGIFAAFSLTSQARL